MKPISADSHIVEGPDVFAGLAERFGDAAPRVVHAAGEGDRIVTPVRGAQGINVARMGLAASRLGRNEPLVRKPGRKPDVAHMRDPEIMALFSQGYAGMRRGLVDGAWRHEDQDVDGLGAEFVYPGFFAMFSMANTALLVALQRELRNLDEAPVGPPPHEIWRRQFHATIEDDRPALATREFIGVENLMWGSDYPHTDSTWPCSGEVLDELFEAVSAADRARITRGNVKALYGV